MPAIVGLLAFASLMAFFAFALAHQQRETEADCALEGAAAADKMSGKGWLLIAFFALLTFFAGTGATILAYCELTGACPLPMHHASPGK